MTHSHDKAKGRASHADFIGIPRRVANSAAFIALPPIARALYVDLRRQHNGRNNGQIAAVLKGTPDHPGLTSLGWPARSVFKFLGLLIEHGLIEKTRQGGIDYLSHICTLYAFTDLPVVANKEKGIAGAPASLTYLGFSPKERPRRTRKRHIEAARGAHIDASSAHTKMHAVPSKPPVRARGAVSDSLAKMS